MLNVEYVVISSPRARDCQCCVAAHGLWCPGVEGSDSATSRQLSRLLSCVSHCQHLLSCVSSSVIINTSVVVVVNTSTSKNPFNFGQYSCLSFVAKSVCSFVLPFVSYFRVLQKHSQILLSPVTVNGECGCKMVS